LEIHIKLGSIHDQAFDLHYLGCLQIRQGEFNLAEENLLKAVQLHVQVENVQGQADAYHKLAEIQLRRQQYDEALTGICRALTLHAQADDIPGQGHDLYVQARILSQQSRLDEAESTIRKAVVLFSRLGQHYYQGRALAKLSATLWRRFKRDGASADHDEALETIDEAIRLFHFQWNEWDLNKAIAWCRCNRKEMVEGAPHTTCEFVDHM
jgi:tetratricopeptide (TPR) repeat protein